MINSLYLHRQTLIFAILFWGLASQTVAQTDERWFQIEVIAFAREYPEQEEQWPHSIALDYPLRWVTLEPANSGLPEAGDQDIAATENLHEPTSAAFQLLGSAERRLNTQASKLANSRQYRVLFHEAWRQPLGPASSAKGILISAGEPFGDHRELEGSITFSLGRFVEAKTKLWLTEFELDQGQSPGDWPLLPTSPLIRTSNLETLTMGTDLLTPENITNTEDSTDNQQAYWSDAIQREEVLPDAAYLPRRIVLLEEDRRLRSGELHYLDHPLMGVLILATPYETPK